MENRTLADAYMLRLPDGWRDAIKDRAARNRRSMNSEILAALESVVGAAATGQALEGERPAAALNTSARESADIINHGK